MMDGNDRSIKILKTYRDHTLLFFSSTACQLQSFLLTLSGNCCRGIPQRITYPVKLQRPREVFRPRKWGQSNKLMNGRNLVYHTILNQGVMATKGKCLLSLIPEQRLHRAVYNWPTKGMHRERTMCFQFFRSQGLAGCLLSQLDLMYFDWYSPSTLFHLPTEKNHLASFSEGKD